MCERLDDAARLIRAAYAGQTIPTLRGYVDPHDGEEAYAIQALNTRTWQAAGRRIVGRKIGLTSKAVQQQLGVDQPDYGVLFEDMRVVDGGFLDPDKVIQPKCEAEVALVLADALTNPDTTAEEVAAATASVHAAIEIVDSRIADWKITFADTVADNGSSAFFVVADEGKLINEVDLYTCGMALEANGSLVSVGAGAACLGHPLNAAAWLASTLARRGEPLRAGDIVLTGALGPMQSLSPGETIVATIGGVGRCSFTFGKV
jgi:2-keto-4-pentenoate hydratase